MMFQKELEQLINKFSKENDSNTPDFILAQYVSDCLKAYAAAVRSRDKWYDGPPEIDNHAGFMSSYTATVANPIASRKASSASKQKKYSADKQGKSCSTKARHWHDIDIFPWRAPREVECPRCGVCRDPAVHYCACPEAIWK